MISIMGAKPVNQINHKDGDADITNHTREQYTKLVQFDLQWCFHVLLIANISLNRADFGLRPGAYYHTFGSSIHDGSSTVHHIRMKATRRVCHNFNLLHYLLRLAVQDGLVDP